MLLIFFLTDHIKYQLFPSINDYSITNYETQDDELKSLSYDSLDETNDSNISDSNFILCVGECGPNNQLRDFVKCAIIAKLNNFTMIIPPFFPHYKSKKNLIRTIDQWYDIKELNKFVKTISLVNFMQKNSGSQSTFLIDCYVQRYDQWEPRKLYAQRSIAFIQNQFGKYLSFRQFLDSSRNETLDQHFASMKNCSSIFLHFFSHSLNRYVRPRSDYLRGIFQNLKRRSFIQDFAQQIIKEIPNLMINNGSIHRKLLTNLSVIHLRQGDRIVMNTTDFINQILYLMSIGVQFTHFHLMSPYLTPEDIQLFQDRLSLPFSTTNMLMHYIDSSHDTFFFDILEQEIAFQAPIFIGSPKSTFSATVLLQRIHQKKEKSYIFSKIPNGTAYKATRVNFGYH